MADENENDDAQLREAHAEIQRLWDEKQSLERQAAVAAEEIRQNSIELARQARIAEVGRQMARGNNLPFALDPQLVWGIVTAAGEVAARKQAERLAEMSSDEILQEARRQIAETQRQRQRHQSLKLRYFSFLTPPLVLLRSF